jgi:hypothetical protein
MQLRFDMSNWQDGAGHGSINSRSCWLSYTQHRWQGTIAEHANVLQLSRAEPAWQVSVCDGVPARRRTRSRERLLLRSRPWREDTMVKFLKVRNSSSCWEQA